MKIPNHIGIICDGNRRFASTIGEELWKGHEYGADKIEEVIDWCQELGIDILTLWLFSTENFNRPEIEKAQLFRIAKELAGNFLKNPKVHENKIKLSIIGDLAQFPDDVQEEVNKIVDATKDYDGFLLNIAVGYGGKQEILVCVKHIAKLVAEGKLKPDEITEEFLEANMYSHIVPDVDLVIRTSGEQRTSGFLIWKTDYAEYYFCEKFWPEFTKEDLMKAILSYSERQRRFGK